MTRQTVNNAKNDFLEINNVPQFLQRKRRETSLVLSKITGELEARIIALACGKAPKGYARWTLRLLAVYERPYNDKRPVVKMDEKPYQLFGDLREPLPMKTGSVQREDCEYLRNGTCSIFIFTEPLSSWR
ncbi:MAG: hypothetical protein LBC76_06490 [Treponema sp.]|nr:hypothetical protein [Treponema sp.]